VEAAPFNLVAWGYLGLCLGWTGDAREMKEARSILDRLIANTPDHPSLPYWLYFKAGVCARQNDYQEAADCAGRSAELQPRFTLAMLEYANALGFLGRDAEAADVAREAFALNPSVNEEAYINELLTAAGSLERVQPHIAGLRAAGIFSNGTNKEPQDEHGRTRVST
jgi:predicted Zn-dependent protease